MSPDQKPEWFQIADADNTASTRKISKGLPIMAILAFATIIGIGAVVAQTQDEVPANATETVTPAVNSNQNTVSSEATAPSTQVSATKGSGASLSSMVPAKESQNSENVVPPSSITNSSASPKAPSTPGVANPLGKKPTGGDEENDDEENDD
jgi:hypothetical protein